MGKTKIVKIDDETYELIKEMETILSKRGLGIFGKWKKDISKVDQGNVVKLSCMLLIDAIRKYDEICEQNEKLTPLTPVKINAI